MSALRDPEVLPDHDLAALVRGARWRRLAVLGDSIAAGVREPVEGYRDLSWVDRVAAPLRAAVPNLAVLNLGRRNLLAAEVRASQLEPALAFRPDLAIVTAGGNDSLRRSFDPGAVERELVAIVGPLRRAGADVVLLELMDIVASGLVPREHAAALNRRMRPLAELTRRVARRHGAILVEMREHPAAADPGVYASDRLHLNARGHAIVGSEAIRALAGTIGQRSRARARLPVPAASARQATAVVGSSAGAPSRPRTR
jgi:lysophospholipase L1-like esterase